MVFIFYYLRHGQRTRCVLHGLGLHLRLPQWRGMRLSFSSSWRRFFFDRFLSLGRILSFMDMALPPDFDFDVGWFSGPQAASSRPGHGKGVRRVTFGDSKDTLVLSAGAMECSTSPRNGLYSVGGGTCR